MALSLTDTDCRRACAEEVDGVLHARKFFDGHGLFLHCKETGSKIWRISYRVNGKQTTRTLGPYPLISLKDARVMLSDIREALIKGQPIGDEAEKTPPPSPPAPHQMTVSEAIAAYLQHRATDLTEGVRANFRRGMEMHVEAFIGHRSLRDITEDDMLGVLKRLNAAGKLAYVRKVKKWSGQVFEWGRANKHCGESPTRHIVPDLVFSKRKEEHYASLSLSEVHPFMARLLLERMEMRSVLACQLLALTWVRTEELRGMLWTEIDGDIWRIPASKMRKNDKAHIVPLSAKALKILGSLREQSRGSRYVFPGDRNIERRMSENAVLALISRIGYSGRMTGHGWRSIASTWANERGYMPDAIERQLGHVEGNSTRGAYNQALYLPERARMLADFADWLYQTKVALVAPATTPATAPATTPVTTPATAPTDVTMDWLYQSDAGR
jgi:integrase